MPTIEEFCTDITILNRGQAVLQGNLNNIKKNYGRVNLFVKCDADISSHISSFGLTVVDKTPSEYHLKVQGEEQAMAFLAKLIGDEITVVKFELREPSLHEIFIEKVGGANERK
jgi:ABC-2 type transport system ATP-binding protein